MYKQKNKEFIKITINAQKGLGIIEFLLGILMIAILSALMIPALVHKSNDSQKKPIQNISVPNKPVYQNTYIDDSQNWKLLYQKAYADASQIWGQLYSENTLNPRQKWGLEQANYHNFTQFMNKFNILKQCASPNNAGCWATNETPDVISGHPSSSGDRCFVDSLGRSWCEASYLGWFVVDINGLKTPNQFGKDRFIFYTISGNDINTSGVPDKIVYDNDYINLDRNKCPNPPCYYKSWLSQ